MRVAVLGANGQLGADVASAFESCGDHVIPLTHGELELSSIESVTSCLTAAQPDLVVNTAAMHHVENCEREPEKAFAVNAAGARNLAYVTRDLGSTIIHVSTDYVFDGKKGEPYTEDDAPLPLNVYGNTKLAGEHFVRSINPRHFVLRTSALYGEHPCRAKGGKNFVDLMLKLGRERGQVRVVNTEFISPTSTAELARQIAALRDSSAFGLYHATAEGYCSWHEFAVEIFVMANLSARVEVADPSEFPAKTPRPGFSVLENKQLKSAALNVFQPWKVGLAGYLRTAATLPA